MSKSSCYNKRLLYLVLLGTGLGFGDLRPHTEVPAMRRWLVKANASSPLRVLFCRLRNPDTGLSFAISLDSELRKVPLTPRICAEHGRD